MTHFGSLNTFLGVMKKVRNILLIGLVVLSRDDLLLVERLNIETYWRLYKWSWWFGEKNKWY